MFGTGYDVGTVAGEAGWTPRKLTTVLVAAFAANALLFGFLVVDFGNQHGQNVVQKSAQTIATTPVRR